MEDLKRTPLYHDHLTLNAKMVSFAGWEMPIQYSGENGGVVKEHHATRKSAGLFDVSHMGEIFFEGPESIAALDFMTCNAVKNLKDGKAQYSAIPNELGGLVDDIIIYRFSESRFLVCVNASNIEKDFEWFTKHNRFNVRITNQSCDWGQIAVQGPRAVEIVNKVFGADYAATTPYFSFADAVFNDSHAILARTGYTGEDGFEIFINQAHTSALWNELLKVGKPFGLVPCGLAARDTLRLEACLPLYGHELNAEWSAIESGLGWIVKPEKKGDFIGREVLVEQKQNGPKQKLIGFVLQEPGIARESDLIQNHNGLPIGKVTSGTITPTVNKALGMAMVAQEYAAIGTKIKAVVRGRAIEAEVVKMPFYVNAQKVGAKPLK